MIVLMLLGSATDFIFCIKFTVVCAQRQPSKWLKYTYRFMHEMNSSVTFNSGAMFVCFFLAVCVF